uniref:Uncharacterized protein n=1 Tax=Lactuca sativa TaxID=4236 RepID=A0A9R1V976_LACSA|nr:hypothetical protein LSAT_V11C600307840 [Lactuca sativa]
MFSFTRKKKKETQQRKQSIKAKKKVQQKQKLLKSNNYMIQYLILKVVVHKRSQRKRSHPLRKKRKTYGKGILFNEKQITQQKECARSMGFGSLLRTKMTNIPLDQCPKDDIPKKIDYERMAIYVEGKELKVITQSVHDMLRILTGGTILIQLDQ